MSCRQFQPDVVMVLVGAWDILDRQVDGHLVRFGSVEYDTSFLHQLDDATTLLASTGAKVVVLTTPFFSRPELVGQTGREWPEYDPGAVDRINSLYRDFLANHPGRYRMVDLNKFVSPQGKFTDELNGQVDPRRRGALHRGGGDHGRRLAHAPAQGGRRPARDPDPADEGERPDSRRPLGEVGQRRGLRATANSPGVVGVIWSVRKKCDSSSPEPMPVRSEPSSLVDDRQHALVAPHVPAVRAPCGAGRAGRA